MNKPVDWSKLKPPKEVFIIDDAIPLGNIPYGGGPAYKPSYALQAKKLCELGATLFDLAQAFDVSDRTISNWIVSYPEFNLACTIGRSAADNRVEHSVYHKAIGYSFESVKYFQYEGEIIEVNTVEHVPPDTKACTWWLKNRKPKEWRDKIELGGNGGGPIQIHITEDDANL